MLVAQLLFGFLAFIHFLPAVAAIAPAQIVRLYGVDASDKTLITLLQHRAVLLGLVGLAFAAAAMRPTETIAYHAVLLGGASMITFLVIVAMRGALGGPLRKIAIVDAIGLVPLAALFWMQLWGETF